MQEFLVIGAGSIGKRHLQCLQEIGIESLYIAEPDDANRNLACQKFNIKHGYVDVEQALQRHYDGVIVAVPNYLHAEVACKVIEKKMNLMLEKPIEITLENARRICNAVRDNGVICLVAYCLRFDLGIRRIREILLSDAIGKVYSVDIEAGKYLPQWRPNADYRKCYSAIKSQGGGVCLDLSHEFDYVRWLFGEAEKVYAFIEKKSDLDIDVEDIAECIIRSDSGAIVRVHLDYLSRVPRRRLSINASRGFLEYNMITQQLKIFDAVTQTWNSEQFEPEENMIYKDQLRHFLKCLEGSQQPLITVEDALKTLKLALTVKSFTA